MPHKPAALGLRERKKRRTRATIREQALRLFVEQGYAQTSIEQIAEAADVSPSTFFRYFPTKEDVVLADDLDPILLKALAEQPVELPPMTALRRAMTKTFSELSAEEIARERERQRVIFSVPELRQALMAELYRAIDMIATATAERLGRSPDDFEVRVFSGALAGAAIAGASGPNGDFDRVLQAIEFLDRGLPLSTERQPRVDEPESSTYG